MLNKRIKKRYFFTALLLLVSVFFARPVLANDETNHSVHLQDENLCATCHRTNNSESSMYYQEFPNQTEFCYSCHGRNSTGAKTNVQDGTYSNGEGLRGGGFEFATMDTELSGLMISNPVTSAHSIDNSLVRAWGSGEINNDNDYGNMITLECTDCHNPHENGNYRMLNGVPHGAYNEDKADPVKVPDAASTTYTITYDETTGYRDTSYAPDNLDNWCAQCHTRYSAGVEAGHVPSGDAVFSYGHSTENLPGGCLSCHVAHGTTATMGSYSGAVTLPDGTSGGGAGDSRLLHTDNRGVCIQCHSSSSLTQN